MYNGKDLLFHFCLGSFCWTLCLREQESLPLVLESRTWSQSTWLCSRCLQWPYVLLYRPAGTAIWMAVPLMRRDRRRNKITTRKQNQSQEKKMHIWQQNRAGTKTGNLLIHGQDTSLQCYLQIMFMMGSFSRAIFSWPIAQTMPYALLQHHILLNIILCFEARCDDYCQLYISVYIRCPYE